MGRSGGTGTRKSSSAANSGGPKVCRLNCGCSCAGGAKMSLGGAAKGSKVSSGCGRSVSGTASGASCGRGCTHPEPTVMLTILARSKLEMQIPVRR